MTLDHGARRRACALLAFSVSLYSALAALYPLASMIAIPRKLWAELAKSDTRVLLSHLLIYAGLFLFYGLNLAQAAQVRARWIWLVFGASSIALLFSFPGGQLRHLRLYFSRSHAV